MRKVLSISETMRAADYGPSHFHASADAWYDENASELQVRLTLIERRSADSTHDRQIEAQTVRVKTDLEEAVSAAKEIFHNWTKALVKKGQVFIER